MEFITSVWNMISLAGQAAGIIVFAVGGIKTVISALEHQGNSTANNVFLMIGGAAIFAIFVLLRTVNLNFG